MAKDSVFSSKRETALTGDQMLESLIRTRNAQRQNTMAMVEAYKHKDTTPDFTATMESATKETERQLQQTSTLENMAYNQGVKNIGLARLGLRQRMIAEGIEYLKGKVLGEIIYEAYWLDDPVKENAVEQIEETIEEVLSYVEESFSGSRVPDGKQSALLKNLSVVIEETAKKAADRICEECEADDTIFPDFTLTDAEESDMDEKLVDLGKDELVDLIKSKVAQVVQDEKEKGMERAEMFREIDQMSADTDPEADNSGETDEELTGAEESMLADIRSGSITLEGATWDTLKVVFSDNKKKAKTAYKTAAKLVKSGRYSEAAKEYETAKKIFNEMLSDVKSTDESTMGTVCSFLLSGWLEHLFIASIGGPSSITSFTKAACSALSATFGLMIPWTIISMMQTNSENVKKSKSSNSSNDYKVHAIAALTANIEMCDKMIGECKKKGKATHSLESVIYTANEQHIINLLESGVDVALFDDPSWGEFKAYVSSMCKTIRGMLNMGSGAENYCHAKCLIEELEGKLSNVPETVPGDVKEFVMAMVGTIYTAVPADSVIISRFGNPTGSPDLKSSSPMVNFASISWTDLFVNIKTNLSSVKSYYEEQASGGTITQNDINGSDCPVSGRNSLAQLVATAQSRILTNNIGGSLFEAMMIGCISTSAKSAMESSLNIGDEEVENAAMIESLLNYTILETLDTIGIYKFRTNDINSLRRTFVQSVSEGTSPFQKKTDKKGLKTVRINTRKMKQKKDINGNRSTSDKVAEM